MLLEVDNVHVHYHKVAALKGIDMEVPEDGIVTIIGANGAGKSTTLRAISGLVGISKGEIVFAGKRIDGLAPEKIVALGIAHVPEGRRIFPGLTVEENLRTGAFLRTDTAEIEKDLDEVFQHFPRLKERRKQWARSLSGGEQQMLAIGRGLMARPRLLMLDEPSLGLAPLVAREIFAIAGRVNDEGTTLLLVEQDVVTASSIPALTRLIHSAASRLSIEPGSSCCPPSIAIVTSPRRVRYSLITPSTCSSSPTISGIGSASANRRCAIVSPKSIPGSTTVTGSSNST